MSISNRKVCTKSLYLTEKLYTKSLYEKSISNRKVYTKSLYIIEKSISLSNSIIICEKSISNRKV